MASLQKRISYLFVFYLLFSTILLFLDSRGSLSFLHQGAQALITPLKVSLTGVKKTFLSPFVAISDWKKKEAEIEKLRQEKADVLSQLSALEALREENGRMRYLLGTALPPSWQFAPLRVVGKVGDTLLATGDSKPEAREPVIISAEVTPEKRSGVFVGKIDSVVGREIKIILPTAAVSKIPVIVRAKDGERRASGILVGRGGNMRLEQVLSSETLFEEDLVLTSGEGAPPELLIGYVSKVLPSEASAWKSAEVEMVVNVENLDFVFVVTKY
ncbi:MAG: rod shape-determining protein MreC [Candidatus Blackburnbacteria bacterium]|nr:rod shape-determining protein MreC [Candidatus Blackburnbacteria bacterium]